MNRNQDNRSQHRGPSRPAPRHESPDDRLEVEHYRRFHERIRRDDDDDRDDGGRA